MTMLFQAMPGLTILRYPIKLALVGVSVGGLCASGTPTGRLGSPYICSVVPLRRPFAAATLRRGRAEGEPCPPGIVLGRWGVLDDIANRYDLGQWRTVRPLPGGFRIATETGDFRVAVSAADRSDASLRFEAMLLSHLEDKAYLAPRLVRTRAGRPWHRSTTGATALVTEWVESGVVDASLAQHR